MSAIPCQPLVSEKRSVLVVDDEPGVRTALTANFRRRGWQVESAAGAVEALRKFSQVSFPLVVTDIRMPDGDGMQVMRTVRKTSPSTAVILLTAFGSVPEAVLAIQSGACDYVMKPFSFEQLEATVQRVMTEAGQPKTFGDARSTELVGESPALRRALERATAAARTDADILVEAESGTGKELLARFIHQRSERHDKPFVAVNCAAVPEQLLESELFGHARGAFTGATNARVGRFEAANGGTLLLDEVGDMPLSLQPKLLRVLQEREFERLGSTRPVSLQIRIIATTNVSLRPMVEAGSFRADLFYRLNVIPLYLPPLRERKEDIPLLAESFAQRIAAASRRVTPRLSVAFLERLQEHSWPGNVRELLNLMRRVLALYPGEQIEGSALDGEMFSVLPRLSSTPGISDASRVTTDMRTVERQLLEKTLTLTSGNRTRAAEMMGVSVRTIRNKIREYGLPPRRYA